MLSSRWYRLLACVVLLIVVALAILFQPTSKQRNFAYLEGAWVWEDSRHGSKTLVRFSSNGRIYAEDQNFEQSYEMVDGVLRIRYWSAEESSLFQQWFGDVEQFELIPTLDPENGTIKLSFPGRAPHALLTPVPDTKPAANTTPK